MSTTLLTIVEASQRLRVSVRTVEREAKDGRLAIVHIRSRRMIEPAELLRYIAANQSTAAPCQSENEATATRSASASAVAAALSAHFRQAQPSPTRGRSRSRLAAPASTLRLVADSTT
jgi:excisionase family DNA binding protein